MIKFLHMLILIAIPLTAAGDGKKLLILGIDGMDPVILQELVDQGKLPTFKKFIQEGDFKPLGTTPPPQSPVAWSTFMTGLNPGGHGIYDFLHRDPKTITPYFSSSKTLPGKTMKVGDWDLPYKGGEIKNLRHGRTFWEYLSKHGIKSVVSRIPANYPPVCECPNNVVKLLSGMGTPDLLGTQGTFTFFTTEAGKKKRSMGGGVIVPVAAENYTISTAIPGPKHPFKEDVTLEAPIEISYDPKIKAARITVGSEVVILKEGEFSDWLRIPYTTVPYLHEIGGIARLYLKQAGEDLELYVSPVNLDPSDPAIPIAHPEEYGHELAEAVGSFYTQNMPPDTKALQHGVFDRDEFLKQVELVYKEEAALLDHELSQFKEGLLFHYFGVVDQVGHMFWATRDPGHPQYTEQLGARYGDVIDQFYQRMDQQLAKVLRKIDQKTRILIVSDHGFTSFRRGLNVNTILLNNGFLKLKDPSKQGRLPLLRNVDWSQTKAYGLGINTLYINLKGRERDGVVTEAEYASVIKGLQKLFTEYTDPLTGAHPIKTMLTRKELYRGDHLELAPDLVLGYDHNYRTSWKSILGSVPYQEVVDNLKAWSGDHSIHFELVPGVVLANSKINIANPSLVDIVPTILQFFGLSEGNALEGRPIL